MIGQDNLITIIIDKHKTIQFIIKTTYVKKYTKLIEQIINIYSSNPDIKILNKSVSSTITCLSTDIDFINWITEMIVKSKNYIGDDILLKLNNAEYFTNLENIKRFGFIENINIEIKSSLKKIQLNNFDKLKNIIFANNFIESEDFENILPDNMKTIQMLKFNKPLEHMISNLNTLELGYYFNSQINIPNTNLKKIIFGYLFNQNVRNLPMTLEEIQFGHSFNQDVKNLPMGVLIIHFGYSFNQDVSSLPESLKTIYFGYSFNQDISNLPIGLENLYIANYSSIYKCDFKQSINSIPKNVKRLALCNEKYNNQIKKLPDKLKIITIVTKYAYRINKHTLNTNIFDIKKIIEKQNLNCKIELIK